VSAGQYADLQRLGTRTITTSEAAAAWQITSSGASRMLSTLAATGLIERLRYGVWLVDRDATAESLATEITAPYPSYVSHVSALYLHGVIDQVPAEVHVVAAAEPRKIETSRGAFRLHRMPTELFGGFADRRGVALATPEKALFDWAYLSVVSGNPNARLPETEWPASFRRAEVGRWIERIASPRIRTMTTSLVNLRLRATGADKSGHPHAPR
jgi:predicted transcriptional regulator of viral defense system